MFHLTTIIALLICVILSDVTEATAEVPPPMKIITEPQVQTDRLGGVDVPSAEVLREMHRSQYILRATGGELTHVPVERVLMSHSNNMSPQSVTVDMSGGVVYCRQSEVFCKSTDGGRTWTSRPIESDVADQVGFRWMVLGDGTFISVRCTSGESHDPAVVMASEDEGKTWSPRAEIPVDMALPNGKAYVERYTHRGLNKLADDTLLWAVDIRDAPMTINGIYMFHSIDGGHTWHGPGLMIDWGSEGGSCLLPSGRVFGTMRYQRALLPGDPPDLSKRTGSSKRDYPWKHLAIMESDDFGLTWSVPVQLTTVFGQTFGYPTVQRDGTVVVIHDTRYGPGPAGSRAMISRDEGKTWLDEVYYLDHTLFVGSYTANVALEDDTILTIAGSSQAGNRWDLVRDKTDLYAIRWKPVKD